MPEKNGQQMGAEQKLRHWMGKIPDYTKELFTPERFPDFLHVMLQYIKYGFDNAVLIAAQCREKEPVLADRGMWEKKYGRKVKDGAEGIRIIVPAKADSKTKKPVSGPGGKPEMEKAGTPVQRFRIHTVYNVSQTEGKPLPERPVFEMAADADNFDIFMKAVTALSPVPVNFAEFGSGKQEYSFNADGEIVIQKGMDIMRTMQTAVRTTARALIDEAGEILEPAAPQDKETISIETESVAYMFCRYFEMDTSGWHFENIAGWRGSMDFESLRASMDMVRKVAKVFTDSMVDSMQMETRKEPARKRVCRNTAGYAKENGEAEEAGAGQIPAAVRENPKPPLVSDMREPEAGLGNFSRAEIEETVFGYAQAALGNAQMVQKVEILGVRVYGSRSREGLYTDKSDLDVVVSYRGDIREDDFFHMLHAEKFQIAGLDVDISPVSMEKTGTLEDYLESADKYLDMKEAQMHAAGQAAPGQAAQREKISFFVAESAGHPVAGRYREGLALPEAVELYQKISEEKTGSVPGIGFRLEGGGVHDGSYMLMTDGRIQKDNIIQNPYLMDNALVQKAAADLEAAFPDRSWQAAAKRPKGMSIKESVLNALRERQARIKGQEQPKQKTQICRKGEAEL